MSLQVMVYKCRMQLSFSALVFLWLQIGWASWGDFEHLGSLFVTL